MTEITTISLENLEPADGQKFVHAEWWDRASRFAVVLLRDALGSETRLRMDVNKRAFLDHFSDKRVDKSVQDKALSVWEVIAAAKS